jgi:hypothetical protein
MLKIIINIKLSFQMSKNRKILTKRRNFSDGIQKSNLWQVF